MDSHVVIAGRCQLTVETLAESLRHTAGLRVLPVVGDRDDFISAVTDRAPALALVDTERLDEDAVALAAEVRRARPTCGVALTVDMPTRVFVERALKAGVLSIVPKSAGLRTLVESVRAAAAGHVIMDPRLLAGGPGGPLTEREADVLRLTASGASVKEMSQNLFLSAGTIRNLASAAIKKLEARNRYDAVRIAREQSWI
ncbi:LuxR C-terminal-related transcriptional regulator [Streptomyces venezuelae]|uniref:helix-turn-helix transcriptional regulator n=1 Tax=Streptomyces venezuelae TaxID=54571 RepID=UPI00378DD1F7